MIQGAMRKCKQMPLHKQIASLIAVVLLTAFTIWNITIIFQAANAWKPSLNHAQDFSQNNIAFSL